MNPKAVPTKKTFKVAVAYQMYGQVEIEADDLEEAMMIVEEDTDIPLPTDSDYVDDSWEVIRDITEEIN